MQGDDPPYLSVGTAVSAKYKGAFCEAKVSKVVRLVKCKVTYKMGLGTATVSDEFIKGPLRIGQPIQAKHPDKKDFVDATITKIQDCSQYTVVFDDGDITTLRRTALCLKSGRHFNESETLDQLPLTHPEHFGNPVVGGRRGRRCRQIKEDSSEGEIEEENEPDLEIYSGDIGRVVCIETSDKKRTKDNWFPGLVVIPSAQPTVRINAKDEFLVRSFKDGRYYTVPKKEVTEFTREMGNKVESSMLAEAVEKVIGYLENDELPAHWERSLLFNIQSPTSESDENYSESSDDETCEEKDHFVAQLIKFMDDSNTPLNKSPMISNKDVDLHRLFRIVEKLGGYNRVTNKNKWRSVTLRMKLPNTHITYNQVKQVYKKCLFSYESFYRTLGVTMLNHSRSTKKSKGRSLIRDKDRTTPVNSPRPEKEDELVIEKKEEEKPEEKLKIAKRFDFKPKDEEKKKKDIVEISDTNSSDATDQSEAASSSSVVRSRRLKLKSNKEHKPKPTFNDTQVKVVVEKFDEAAKKTEKDEEKVLPQQTRSKIQQSNKIKEVTIIPEKKVRETKTPVREAPSKIAKPIKKPIEDDKKRGRKKTTSDEKTSDSSASEVPNTQNTVTIGDKLKVYYGPTHESKVTYEAKVIEIDKDTVGPIYLVHYTGWNTRYDEWITPNRIAENLSANTKAKKLKQHATSPPSKATANAPVTKPPGKRGRGMSITGRSSVQEGPRSSTPSIIPSTSTRTKSPATPTTTRTYRSKRQAELNRRTRLTSAQAETLNNSESESESEIEFESPGNRLDIKGEQVNEIKTYRRKLVRTPSARLEKRKEKDDEDTEKEEDDKTKRLKRIKKNLDEKSTESDDDNSNPPKGRDFDLNQIRSELKGFVKAVKIPTPDLADKDSASSDESISTANDAKAVTEELYENEKPEDKTVSSDDIYEFKEPEPFEFETRTKTVDDKTKKRLVPRILDEMDKSPKKKGGRSPLSKQDDTAENDIKRFRRTPLKKSPLSSEDDNKPIVEDPFDKLIESPSFHSGKEKIPDNRTTVTRVLNLDEPLSLFRELPETTEDDSRDILDLSDTEESQTQPLFTRNEQLFSESNFSKASPDHNTLDDNKQKDSDDDEAIRASIQNVIEQSSLAEYDSGDELVITQPTLSYQAKKKDDRKYIPTLTETTENKQQEEKQIATTSKQISPALKETNPTLMETICTPPEIPIKPEIKEIPVKSGPKIADSILHKFNMIKTKVETKIVEPEVKKEIEDSVKPILPAVDVNAIDTDAEIASLTKDTKPVSVDIKTEVPETKPKLSETKLPSPSENKFKPIESKITTPEPQPKSAEQKIKFNETKSKIEVKSPELKPKLIESPKTPPETKLKIEPKLEPLLEKSEVKPELIKPKCQDTSPDAPQLPRPKSTSPQNDIVSELKKRSARKIISKEFIDDSDTDSSDSEKKLVIARSDNDSPTTDTETKMDVKEEETSKTEVTEQTDDNSQSQEPPKETNNSSENKPSTSTESEPKSENKIEPTDDKEEETDSHLHSLLLCEETIPGSPTPPSDDSENVTKQQSKSVLEMPFASAPGSSNNTSKLPLHNENKSPKDRHQQQSMVLPIESRNASSTVLDNTPPTTPESTLSNLSPRGDNEDLSPNTADNDSYKSIEAEGEYSNTQRRGSANKITPYSEEDTLMNAENSSLGKRIRDDLVTPAPCKKRRRSCKGTEEIVPVKRGRKPANRSRHNTNNTNSDSDDMSENSMSSNIAVGANIETRPTRSPRPSKYNFFVELDPSWDSSQRIALLQQKLQELRKTYSDVKSELATIERRRKKIRRREREAKLAAKLQESIAT